MGVALPGGMLARPVALLAVSLAVVSLTPAARAERLLAPVLLQRSPVVAPPLAGVSRVQPLTLGRAALADLRGRRTALVEGFPLGQDGSADLELERFDPFPADARVEVMEEKGPRALALPDRAYFAGTVRGKPGSRAFVVAAPDAVHGFVALDGAVYPFGPDGAGGHRAYGLADVDAGVHPAPRDFCANDLYPEGVLVPEAAAALQAHREGARVPSLEAATVGYQANVAIETDQELRAKFTSDQAALEYLASLAAAASAIYERDVGVRLTFSYVRLWGTADPWSATDTVNSLYEVQNYWNASGNGMTGIDRALVHFVSGKPVRGGVAYLSALCNDYYAYGVSQVFGSFNLASPSQIWDVLVFAHELGHTFGSTHSHCYNPPIDHCYNEQGCYAGPVEPSRGAIMSYCHLNQGGLANIDLEFGPRVSQRIRDVVGAVSCLAPAAGCGNGVLDSGEQCDDGNTADGDCCSAQCTLALQGTPCTDDGNACTTDTCSLSGSCLHTPNTNPCDDGDGCTNGDQCANGICSGTTFADCGPCLTCAPDGSCILPPADQCVPALPKKSQLTLKDKPEDAKDALTWTWTGRDAVDKQRFGAPTAASDLTLCLYDARSGAATLLVAATAPASGICAGKPCWSETPTGFKYADKELSPDGLLKVQLRAGGAGRARITVGGKGGGLTLPSQPFVPPVTVRLERGDGNACWSATYAAPAKNVPGLFRARQ